MDGTIYDFIRAQEVAYSKPIEIEEGWMWNMKEHIRRSFLYKNSQFEEENENRDLRPFKNIIISYIIKVILEVVQQMRLPVRTIFYQQLKDHIMNHPDLLFIIMKGILNIP